jgi:hypothetical protein
MTDCITVYTSDSKIWNYQDVIWKIANCTDDVIIDLHDEGPCIQSLGLIDLLQNAKSKRIVVNTCNAIEYGWSLIEYKPPMHFVQQARQCVQAVQKTADIKRFGMFIGRSNTPRLLLASVIHKLDSVMAFHYDSGVDFHAANLGLESLLSRYGHEYFKLACDLINCTPIKLDPIESYPILNDQHFGISDYYSKFFVEIVCESYFSGDTFFPTEKTWRAIALCTPFIIQGPANYLRNLKALGFQTFDRWWDEGYSEDPSDHQPMEIIKVIDYLQSLTSQEIFNIYQDMLPVLEHNYNVLQNLTAMDFLRVRNEQ